MYDQKLSIIISDLQVPSHNKQVNITWIQKPSFFLCVFLSLRIVNHSFIKLIFIVLGQKPFQAIFIHSFIHSGSFVFHAGWEFAGGCHSSIPHQSDYDVDTHGWPCRRCPCIGHHGTSWLAGNSQWQWQWPARPGLLNLVLSDKLERSPHSSVLVTQSR